MYFPIGPPVFRDPGTPLTFAQRELRQLVLKQVEAHPDTFDMDEWERRGACGTTRCIAGWAQFFGRGRVSWRTSLPTADDPTDYCLDGPFVENDAVELLGLTEDEFYVHSDYCGDDDLFHLDDEEALERLREITRTA